MVYNMVQMLLQMPLLWSSSNMAQPMVIQKQMTWYLNNRTLFQLVLRITFAVEFSVKLNVHQALKDLQIAMSGKW